MTTIPTGRFVWFEYVSNDEKRAQAFFGELFQWKTKVLPTAKGSYTMIGLGNETIGGYLQPQSGAPQHPHWLAHLQVANVQDSVSKVRALGGRIVKEATRIGDDGTMSVVIDNGGATLALWQPVKPEGAARDYSGTDGSWIWNELYTEDVDKSLSFYKAIGGFEIDRMKVESTAPGPDRYDVLKTDGKGRAGVMKMAGVPPMWMPYVKVANTDATVERAKKLGATVRLQAETIPNVGRLAILVDPLGAPIGVLKPQPT